MSSIAGLIVPNNFNITDKGGLEAEGLYSDNKANTVAISASPNPVINQALVATSATAATWQDVALASNTLTMTQKTMDSNTNVIAAESVWAGGKSQKVNLGDGGIPSVGQILKCTSAATPPNSAAAVWVDHDVNVVRGGFSGVGAAAAATVLTTIELGNNPGSFVIEGIVTANLNTGTESAGWMVRAVFHQPLAGGDVVKDTAGVGSDTVISQAGTFAGEGAPTWEVVPASTQIKLVKTGTVNSVWGGSWKYSKSGTV